MTRAQENYLTNTLYELSKKKRLLVKIHDHCLVENAIYSSNRFLIEEATHKGDSEQEVNCRKDLENLKYIQEELKKEYEEYWKSMEELK
mgnify:FL=1